MQAFFSMKINNPYLENKDYELLNVKQGRLYLFDNYIITEFNEGINITFENFSEVSEIIKNHYKNEPFGFISNRINSYSIDLNDAHLYNKTFPNLKAYAVVVYKSLTHRVFEVESHFFNFNREVFKNLENATEWVENTLAIEA